MTARPMSRRVYRLLLRLAPEHLRRSHGRDMEDTFVALLDDATDRRGAIGWMAVWFGATRDLVDAFLSARLAWARRSSAPVARRWSTWGPLGDMRRAVRLLKQKPAFAAVAVVTLGIGLGANAAIFSVIDAVLLRPLPFTDADRVVTLWESHPQDGTERSLVAPPTFSDWRDQATAFERIVAYSPGNAALTGGPEPVRVATVQASSDVFQLLGVPLRYGRPFPDGARGGSPVSLLSNSGVPEDRLEGEGLPGAEDELAIVSYGFASRWFGDPAAAVGQSLRLNDRRRIVIGVLPEDFEFPNRADVWLPLSFDESELVEPMRGARYLNVLARVRDGVSLAQAEAELATVAAGLGDRHPINRGWTVAVVGLHDLMTEDYRQNLILLQLAVGLVLLIACGNVASLILARASDRLRDRAVRRALGATAGRLARQNLVENLTLALLGGSLGVLLASWTVAPLIRLAPAAVPRIEDAAIGDPVLLFCFGAAVVVALLMTAIQQAAERGRDENTILRTGQAATGGRVPHRVRSALIVAEMALSLVLLAGAGVLVRSFVRLASVDPGFAIENVAAVTVSLPRTRYPDAARQYQAFAAMTEAVARVPGVEGAGLTTNLPLIGSAWPFGYAIDGRPATDERLVAEFHAVTPGYFEALGLSVRGRTFHRGDDVEAPPVVIINETMARRHWPDRPAVGQRVSVVSQNGPVSREIVGVVADIRHAGLVADPGPEVYVPMAQDTWAFGLLAIRTAPDVRDRWPDIRDALAGVDPELPLTMTPMTDFVGRWLAPLKFQMVLVGLFAAFALVMAALGIYGVIAYLVSMRTHEIGIRLAMGATPATVFRSVVGRGLALAALAIPLGLVGAVLVNRSLAALLYRVSPSDGATLAGISFLIVLVACLACWLPARRAMRVDPIRALRWE